MADLPMLKIVMKPKFGDGPLTPLLCDQRGEPLPGQISVKIETSADDTPIATVTFGSIEFE